MNRKDFIQIGIAAGSLTALGISCKPNNKIKGSIIGASGSVGHMLKDKLLMKPVSQESKKVVIVGAGISGLSAARYLQEQGLDDIVILELEKVTGGNAANGKNTISAFPLGAHYVPIPNNDLSEYLLFLQQAGAITEFNTEGLPVYNEKYICFEPAERLYINGKWQEGLIPHFGVSPKDKEELNHFLAQMQLFRTVKGNDGKDAFAIPINNSSKDSVYGRLDKITMKDWLIEQGFTSDYLHWYVNYCTKDDFGTDYANCSAWAGIHYFAGRKGRSVNASYSDVLTWPEGNGFLADKLSEQLHAFIRKQCLVTKIELSGGQLIVEYFDTNKKQVKSILAAQCILAVPQFIAGRLLNDPDRLAIVKKHFAYTPWMVANIVTNKLEERSGESLSWDNVIYKSDSLGYIDATHQLLQQNISKRNLTYYLPLTQGSPSEARRNAQQKTHPEWVKLIVADLKKIHPNIETAIEEINITLWGHAMVQPRPGIIHGDVREKLGATIHQKIHFAHTDITGISIFEEAFYVGLNAAKKVLAHAV